MRMPRFHAVKSRKLCRILYRASIVFRLGYNSGARDSGNQLEESFNVRLAQGVVKRTERADARVKAAQEDALKAWDTARTYQDELITLRARNMDLARKVRELETPAR